MLSFVLDSLSPEGTALVAGKLKQPSLIPPNLDTPGDITSRGGWGALTGNQT